jgi:ribosomal protein S18 acetylase RimI-like enzyme
MADVSVRPATAGDAPALAAVQQAAWTHTLAGALPAAVLDQLGGASAVARWRLAATDPPTRRHRVLVAVAGASVVGFAAIGPSDDPDAGVADAELLAFGVSPDHGREGHGSRLVNASVDHLRSDGFSAVGVWLSDGDPLRAFLEAAGWAADGARRTLDLYDDGAVVVEQQRLHTVIAAGTEDAEPPR